MDNIVYICKWIVGSNYLMTRETRTLFHLLLFGINKQTGNMKLIPLTQGLFTQVDNEDYEFLNQWKWWVLKGNNTDYAMRRVRHGGKLKAIMMHRLLLNTPENMDVDHRDHNGLNNQKLNLRNCTRTQNQMHQKKRKNIKYKGVSFYKRYNKFRVQITISKGNRKQLGYYNSEEQAARVYDETAKKYHGEFAVLNFK